MILVREVNFNKGDRNYVIKIFSSNKGYVAFVFDHEGTRINDISLNITYENAADFPTIGKNIFDNMVQILSELLPN